MKEIAEEIAEKTKCLSCGNEYEGNYCPKCGQSKKVGRLSIKRILTESLPDIYNLDNKFVRTCVDLFRRPGKMILDYLNGDRIKYYKPMSLLFLLASAYIVIQHFCGIDTEHPYTLNQHYTIDINGEQVPWCVEGSFLDKALRTLYDLYWNVAWSTICSITLFIVPLKFAFRKTDMGKKLNLAEFFFIMLFLNCQMFIVKIIQTPLNYACSFSQMTEGLFDDSNVDIVWFLLGIWALMQIFGTGKRRTLWSYIKAKIYMYIFVALLSLLIVIPVSIILGTSKVGEFKTAIDNYRNGSEGDSIQINLGDGIIDKILE